MKTIPVIDLFAGPGGLGEGFTRAAKASVRYDVRISCELDPVASQTLRLRKFFHLSESNKARSDYYRFVQGQLSFSELISRNAKLWKESDKRVVEVELGRNSTRLLVHQRIRKAIGTREFILIGGPPCQAYSLVGRSRRLGAGSNFNETPTPEQNAARHEAFYRDPKHNLYREYLEIIAVHRPAVFVMENVKGLMSARSGSSDKSGRKFEQITNDLRYPKAALDNTFSVEIKNEFGDLKPVRYRLVSLSGDGADASAGYELFSQNAGVHASNFLLRSENYGVPQTRHRIIIVGIREDLRGDPPGLSKLPTPSVREIIGHLPALRSMLSKKSNSSEGDWFDALQNEVANRIPLALHDQFCISRTMKEIKKLKMSLSVGSPWQPTQRDEVISSELANWLHDKRLKGVIQHEARSHMASDLARYLYCASYSKIHGRSPQLEDWPISLRPNHKNVTSKDGKLSTTAFSDRFKVQGTAKEGVRLPSTTITSHISKDGHYYIHYDPHQVRSLSVREAARLQSFPDNYFFCGNKTQQYHQVGNAVPPFLAKQIAESIAELLTRLKL